MDQMSDEIKRVKRELKFKGKIIDFYQDTMEINGDHTVIWDFIKHKGAAAVVPVTDEGKILMVRQYRNALERYTLEIPAGALDTADEPGITCASRELEEETGYRSENLEWLINLCVASCEINGGKASVSFDRSGLYIGRAQGKKPVNSIKVLVK